MLSVDTINTLERMPVCIMALSPELIIITASDLFLKQTATTRDQIIGRGIFEVFPENPETPEVMSMHDLRNSLETVIKTLTPRQLETQRYDVPDPAQPGKFIIRYWDPLSTPVLDDDGELLYIIHMVTNVTDKILAEQNLAFSKEQLIELNNKLLAANQEIQLTNKELLASNDELISINEDLAKSQEELKRLTADLENRVQTRTKELSISQNTVREQRDRLSRFFMQAPAGICILDGPRYIFELVNPAFQHLFPGRKLLGKSVLDAIPEIYEAPIWEALNAVYETGKTFEGKEQLIPLARTYKGPIENRYFNFIYQARMNALKRVDGVLVFAFEITDMVLAKQKLEDSEKRLNSFISSLPQIACMCTPTGEVTSFNKRWQNFTGLSFDQSKEWGWIAALHPDERQAAVDIYLEIIQSAEEGEFECRLKRINGEYKWHLMRITPVKNESNVVQMWIGIYTDVQVFKDLQQEKDDFLSIASHELKTPLTSLRANLQLLERSKTQSNPEVFPVLIERANVSMSKISSLIDKLLNLGRVKEKMLHFKKSYFLIADLLKNCSSIIQMNENFNFIIQGDKSLYVNADEHQIDQVIVNLINNAVKYAPESRNIYLIIEKVDNMAKISVKDNGAGIDPSKVPHLFERYYQAHPTGRHNSGLGLGLYISSEIIRRHGGQIGVESELGKGSTFWFTLPL